MATFTASIMASLQAILNAEIGFLDVFMLEFLNELTKTHAEDARNLPKSLLTIMTIRLGSCKCALIPIM